MENNKLKTLIFSAVLLSSFAFAGMALASEVTGTLSTNIGNTISGTVVAPTTGGGGGGGGVVYGGGGGGGGGIGLLILNRKAGDANNDGRIDLGDFNILMVNWGKSGLGISGDLNSDGRIDLGDFNILMVNWGK